jgi:RNA polymerase primary sigma factor
VLAGAPPSGPIKVETPMPYINPHAEVADDGLRRYFGRIGEVGLLTADDEARLAAAIAAGEEDARARLIEANLRLVVCVARKYRGQGLPMDDLVGEGNLGLIKAAERFDAAFGVRFSTYAAHWIRQAIREALMDSAPTIRVPAYLDELLVQLRRVERFFERSARCRPGFDEVAGRPDSPELRRVMAALTIRAWLTSLGAEGVDERSGRGLDQEVEGVGGTTKRQENPTATAVLPARLDARERCVLSLRYGLGGTENLSRKEVGERMSCSSKGVRKLELRALRKLSESYANPAKPEHCSRERPLPLAN